nr:E1 envelope glycoprotein [Ruhugu virus]
EAATAQLCARAGCTVTLVAPVRVVATHLSSKVVEGGCFRPWDLEATGACVCEVPTDVSCSGMPQIPAAPCARIDAAAPRSCGLWVLNAYASGGYAQLASYFEGEGEWYKHYHPTKCSVRGAWGLDDSACWGFPTDKTMSIVVMAGYVAHPAKRVRVRFHREVQTVWELDFGGTRCNLSTTQPTCMTPAGAVEARLPPEEDELTEYIMELGAQPVVRWGVGLPNCHGPDWASPVCQQHSPDCNRTVGVPPEPPTIVVMDADDPRLTGAPPPGHVWAVAVKGTQPKKCGLRLLAGPYGHAALEMPEWLQAHAATSPHQAHTPLLLTLRTRSARARRSVSAPRGVRVEGCYACGTPANVTGVAPPGGVCVLQLNAEVVGGVPPGPFHLQVLLNGGPPYAASCGGESALAGATMIDAAQQSFVGVAYGTHETHVLETSQTWSEWARAHWWQLLLGSLAGLLAFALLACMAKCCYHLRGAFFPSRMLNLPR